MSRLPDCLIVQIYVHAIHAGGQVAEAHSVHSLEAAAVPPCQADWTQ